MKTLVVLLLSAGLSSVVCAQTNNDGKQDGKNVSDTLLLKEVVVKGERVNTRDNTLHFLPTQAQKESPRTGYGLLSRLALPYVTVNEVTKSITVPPNMGQLQIRINDVVADKHDLIALNPKTVRRVDFLQNPGARYGTDVSFVVNIVTDKAERGYAVGVDAMQTITSMRTSEDVFAKVNRGKSEFGVNYSFGYSDMKKQTYEETADYLMPDNTVQTISRTDVDWRSKNLAHDMQLQYVLSDSSRYTLQATLGSTLSRVPRNTRTRTETYGSVSETLPISSTDETKSALADLYFNYNLTKRQGLTAYATASYTSSDYSYAYGGTSPYSYASSSRARALYAEAVYENRMSPFTLSAGATFANDLTDIAYHGGTEADNSILRQGTYLFAQVKGRLANLAYTVGTGVSYRHYRQGPQRNDYWLWRPQLQISWSPWRPFSLSYDITMTQKPPRLEYLGDATVMNNPLEFTAGNPALRPNKT